MRINEDPSRWTDLDLEAFHDGELPAEEAAQVSLALMQSPGLRAHLAEIVRVDAAVKRAGEDTGVEPAVVARRGVAGFGARGGRRMLVAMAALLTLLVGGAIYFVVAGGSGAGTTVEAADRGTPLIAEDVRHYPLPTARIVLSVDIPASVPARDFAAVRASPAHVHATEIAVSPPAASAGPAPLSTAELRRRLDAMKEPRERLAACVAWARDGRQAPALFEHIERIAAEPRMLGSVVGALRDLGRVADLRPYVRQAEQRIAAAHEPRG